VSLPSDREIEIRRVFDAPRELVWEMWTRSEHLVHWWGPTGWTLPVSEMDFRVGGRWFYCMEGPDGMKSCGRSEYLEIEKPERIVLKDLFVDDSGEPIPDMPEGQSTLIFEAQGSRTLVIDIVLYPSKKARDEVIKMGMEAGIDQTFDRLEAYLAEVQ
jgi:uncharacterized protein YndB with AHSA1/START domain